MRQARGQPPADDLERVAQGHQGEDFHRLRKVGAADDTSRSDGGRRHRVRRQRVMAAAQQRLGIEGSEGSLPEAFGQGKARRSSKSKKAAISQASSPASATGKQAAWFQP